ncbi:MAG: Isocitrate lyase, partial [uncultured Gemmatimonadaceae bacterium]
APDTDPDLRARRRLRRRPARARPLRGHPPRLLPRGRGAPGRFLPGAAHLGRPRRPAPVAAPAERALREHARRAHGHAGAPAGEGGAEGHLPVRLAGGGGRQLGLHHVPRPVALPGGQRPDRHQAHQQRAAPRRPDRDPRARGRQGRRPDPLHGAGHRRRRGRLRRRAQRLRADAGDDRGGRRRRPLRGPARLREEVRPPGRQGAGADLPAHPHLERRAPRRRRGRRADRAALPHGRRERPAPHLRRGRARPALHQRRAHAGGFLPHHPGHGQEVRDRALPRLRALRRPALVGDVGPRPERRARVRGGHPSRVPGQDARLQLLAVLQLAAEDGRRGGRAVPARDRRHGLQVPVRDPGRLPQPEPVHVQAGPRLQGPRHGRLLRAATGGVRGRGRRLHRGAPPARGGRRLLRRRRHRGRRRPVLHHRARPQHGSGAVPRRRAQGRGAPARAGQV